MYKSEEFIIDLGLQANMTRNRNADLCGRFRLLVYVVNLILLEYDFGIVV